MAAGAGIATFMCRAVPAGGRSAYQHHRDFRAHGEVGGHRPHQPFVDPSAAVHAHHDEAASGRRPRKRHALKFAAGKLGRKMIRPFPEAEFIEEPFRAVLAVLAASRRR